MVLAVLLAVVSAGLAAALVALRRSRALRTRLEQELRDAQEAAARAARVRDDLVAMVSHELRMVGEQQRSGSSTECDGEWRPYA